MGGFGILYQGGRTRPNQVVAGVRGDGRGTDRTWPKPILADRAHQDFLRTGERAGLCVSFFILRQGKIKPPQVTLPPSPFFPKAGRGVPGRTPTKDGRETQPVERPRPDASSSEG